MPNTISEVTRRAIADLISTSSHHWAGRLPEGDFLARLYDLTRMSSTDWRHKNAAGDIRQHRENWSDWSDDWVFYDDRFNLIYGPDRDFLRFLCETVHPVVRVDPAAVDELVGGYNRALAPDGWQLVESGQISGRPIFTARQADGPPQIFEEPTGWPKVDRQLQEVRLRLDTAETEEQFQAVGLLCREVLISAAQQVYDPARHKHIDGIDVGPTDANRMLQAIFDHELGGGGNEEARAHAKAALKLAVALQHKRTAEFRMAALCGEATSSVVRIVAVLGGRRGRAV